MTAWYARVSGLRTQVRLGSLRRVTPISEHWGFDRGTPVDRYYIERFLGEHTDDITGRVLEVKDSGYTTRFGHDVTGFDVLDIDSSNPHATVLADLADVEALPWETFDCFVLTQTLQFILPVEAAVRGAHKLLRSGGVVLVTVPALSKVDKKSGVDFWRFTQASCRTLFANVFGEGVEVRAYGNVLAAMCFLMGLAREDVTDEELDISDEVFPVIVAVRAIKA